MKKHKGRSTADDFAGIVEHLTSEHGFTRREALDVAGGIQRNNILQNAVSDALQLIPRPSPEPRPTRLTDEPLPHLVNPQGPDDLNKMVPERDTFNPNA